MPRAVSGSDKVGCMGGGGQRREEETTANSAAARFTSHLARAGQFSAGVGRLTLRPQLPSARSFAAAAAVPARLELLAFRRM